MFVKSPSLSGTVPGRLLFACLLLFMLSSQRVQASSLELGGYFFAKGQQHMLRVGSTRFTLPAASVAGGYWVDKGIGLELELGSSLGDDERNGIDLEVDRLVSLGVRLEAPPTDNLALYFVFSLTSAELSSRFSQFEPAAVGSSLDGYGITFGMTWHTTVAGLVVDTGGTHNRFESDLGINTLHIGLRYSIGAKR